MWWPFKKETSNINPEEELKGLLKAQEMLNKRFEMKQVSNETYLQKANELNKKIAKCRKKIDQDS